MALDFKKSPMDCDTICGIIEDITVILLYVISNTIYTSNFARKVPKHLKPDDT